MREPPTTAELIDSGLTLAEAEDLSGPLRKAWQNPPQLAWREISRGILRSEHPFRLHSLLFEQVYGDWNVNSGPAPVWLPDDDRIPHTNIGRWMHELGLPSVAAFHAWSTADRSEFWRQVIDRLGIRFARPCDCVLDTTDGVERPHWLRGARLNIVDSCFTAEPSKPAVVYHDEAGRIERLSYAELDRLVNRVAGGLAALGHHPGDAIAIYMPMNVEAVAAYLGIIRAGGVAVSIADSLAVEEITVRFRLSNTKAVITQDAILRGGKHLPLYDKVVEAAGPRGIVVSTGAPTQLRADDVAWQDFLSTSETFQPHMADPDDPINILFSSGTTGEPKAIPWTQVTPIKCALDGYLHQDVQGDDVCAWPTNLGWMMGPWLIYASFINRATLALYGGAPTGRDFGQFVADARVTMLGVIPSLVKTWRATDCMRGLDWRRLRRFSSTGECSNADDMHYLMALAEYKPVIEYCGGTELAGGYIGSTMAQPNALAAFSTPSFGIEMLLSNESEEEQVPRADAASGEVFLVPPSIGMSTKLLRHDHYAVYFAETPSGPQGETLRRHGDAMEHLGGGYYRALGRTDDTMNLGGIKVSSVEIERVLNEVPGIRETAAVAVSPARGGPSLLWIFAVLSDSRPDDLSNLRDHLQQAIRGHLNPLFKIQQLIPIESLPRTPSHKIMRRLLRDDAVRRIGSP